MSSWKSLLHVYTSSAVTNRSFGVVLESTFTLCGWRMICNVTQDYALMNVHCILKCQPRLCYVAEWLHARSVSRGGIYSPPNYPSSFMCPILKLPTCSAFMVVYKCSRSYILLQVYFHDVEKYQSCVNIHSKKASNLVPPVGKLHEMLHIRSGRDALAQTPSIIITKMITRCSILLKGSINAFCASSYRE